MENLGPLNLPLSFFGTAVVVLLAIVLYFASRRHWGQAAFWIALLLAGQACALQLVASGPIIRLQMFQPWGDLLKMPRAIFFAAFLAQAVIVFWGIRRYWPAIKLHGPRVLTWPKVLLLLLLLAYAATTITPEWAQSLVAGNWRELAFRTASNGSKIALGLLMALTGIANLVLAAATIPAEKWDRLVTWWDSGERRWLPWAAAAWVVVISSALAWMVLQRVPHVPDEVAYVFQAKHLAIGRLSLPAPPDADAMPIPFAYPDATRWVNAMPIGWPAVLAAGEWLGVRWLVNPLLGGLGILLAHALVARLHHRKMADGVALLLAGSPWLLWMSASLMPHAASLVLFLLVTLGAVWAAEPGAVGWGLLTGLSCGALLHVRPLEAVVAALVAGSWWLARGWAKMRVLAVAATLAGGTAMTVLFLAYNRYVTGDPSYTPLNGLFDRVYYVGSNRLGFGADIGNWGWPGLDALPGHGPIDVFMNTNQNLHLLQFELFGWSCGSLLPVFLLALWGPKRQDALMWGWLAAVWAAMSLYWFSGGSDFGARYWYAMILPCAVLTIRGAQGLASRMLGSELPPHVASKVWALVVLASLSGTVNFLMWRGLDKYLHYRGTRAGIDALAVRHEFGRSLVLIRGEPWPDYGSVFPSNPPGIDRGAPGPIYALEKDPASLALLREHYSDRRVWIVAGPTVTGEGFRVVVGPILPGESLPDKPSP